MRSYEFDKALRCSGGQELLDIHRVYRFDGRWVYGERFHDECETDTNGPSGIGSVGCPGGGTRTGGSWLGLGLGNDGAGDRCPGRGGIGQSLSRLSLSLLSCAGRLRSTPRGGSAATGGLFLSPSGATAATTIFPVHGATASGTASANGRQQLVLLRLCQGLLPLRAELPRTLAYRSCRTARRAALIDSRMAGYPPERPGAGSV